MFRTRRELVSKRTVSVVVAMILLVAALFPGYKVSAGPDSLDFHMPNGGQWIYEGKINTEYVKKMGWSGNDWRNIEIVQRMEFIPPDVVQVMANDMLKSIGADMSKEMVKHGIEVAIASGIDKAKKSLTTKYGATKAAKIVPFLSFFAWGYTAYDILTTVADGHKASFLADAASQKKGVIYKQARSTGDMSKWYLWDGSSRYGKYPYAILNPNKYQFGRVIVN